MRKICRRAGPICAVSWSAGAPVHTRTVEVWGGPFGRIAGTGKYWNQDEAIRGWVCKSVREVWVWFCILRLAVVAQCSVVTLLLASVLLVALDPGNNKRQVFDCGVDASSLCIIIMQASLPILVFGTALPAYQSQADGMQPLTCRRSTALLTQLEQERLTSSERRKVGALTLLHNRNSGELRVTRGGSFSCSLWGDLPTVCGCPPRQMARLEVDGPWGPSPAHGGARSSGAEAQVRLHAMLLPQPPT